MLSSLRPRPTPLPVKSSLHQRRRMKGQTLCKSKMLDSWDTSHEVGKVNDLPEFEQGKWKCPKCGAQVSNEHGYCPNYVDVVDDKGKPLLGKDGKPFQKLCQSGHKMPEGGPIGWGGAKLKKNIKDHQDGKVRYLCSIFSLSKGQLIRLCVACQLPKLQCGAPSR